jgi:hypothetical protein
MDERASRDILCNTAFVLWAFAVEGLVFFTFRGQPRNALLSLIAVPAGYVAYRAAVAKAEAWGDAVETLVDLHRDKLHAALKLPRYSNASEERRVWERATRFFVSVDDPARGDDVFERQDAPAVTAIPSGEIAVPAPLSAVVDDPAVAPDPSWLRWIEYVVLVARQAEAASDTAELLVDDPRVARIPEPPAGLQVDRNVSATAQVVRATDGSDLLLWKLTGLAGGSAISLRYQLPLLVLHTDPSAKPKLEPGIGVVLDPAPAQVLKEVRLSHLGTSGHRPELRLDNSREAPWKVEDNTYVWRRIRLGGRRVWLIPPDDSFR